MPMDKTEPPPNTIPKNDLKIIKGISDKFEAALHQCGIFRFKQLAAYESSPDSLQELVIEKSGKKLPLSLINRVISQAIELAGKSKSTRTKKPDQAEAPQLEEYVWNEKSDFAVHFEQAADEHGNTIWRTQVYYGKSLEEVEIIPGIDPADWADWMMKHARLPEIVSPLPQAVSHLDTAVSPPKINGVKKNQIQIKKVRLSEPEDQPSPEEKKLEAEIKFELKGESAEKLTEEQIPFQVEIHAINLESGRVNFVESKRDHLRPGQQSYTVHQSMPLPELGKYEIQSVVKMLSPGDLTAHYKGFRLNVVP